MAAKDLPFTTLLLATGNAGKTAELRELLADISVGLIDLSAFPGIGPVAETGSTFRENAELKAAGYARATNMFAIADDSGLEVLALGGEPGVRSARYGGDELDDRGRTDLLLNNMRNLAASERSARFVSAISFSDPSGEILFTGEGYCPGSIAEGVRGTNGFGYDPVFIPDGHDRTFGELSAAVKDEISHRSQASRLFIRFLLDFTGF